MKERKIETNNLNLNFQADAFDHSNPYPCIIGPDPTQPELSIVLTGSK